MRTGTAAFTIAEVLVFVAQSALTTTPAHAATEPTPNVPVPRHADALSIAHHAPHTPLRPQVFARFLTSHPDSSFVSELVNSLTHGFNIGYEGPRTQLTAPNLASARQHAKVVNDALSKEIAENRMAGPYPTPPSAISAAPVLVLSRRRMEDGD